MLHTRHRDEQFERARIRADGLPGVAPDNVNLPQAVLVESPQYLFEMRLVGHKPHRDVWYYGAIAALQ